MYINETHIAYYAVFATIGLFVGMFVDWMNKRLPDYKKVFSKDLSTEYFAEFKPNYILMIITAVLYIAILYQLRFCLRHRLRLRRPYRHIQ